MKRFLRLFAALVLCLAAATWGEAVAAQETAFEDFNFNWRFAAGKPAGAADPNLDDSAWQRVDLPHDWAIAGPFGPPGAPGNQGKLPWIGDGWYRKTFALPKTAEGKRLILIFDGVMALPTVYLNGREVGRWIYGYNSFHVDATDAAQFGGNNVLAVHADTYKMSSRWYPGAGIYRKVTLRLADAVHVPVWGVFVTTPEVTDTAAKVNVKVEVNNRTEKPQRVCVESLLLDPAGKEVATCQSVVEVPVDRTVTASLDATVPRPKRWDILHPHLYTAVTRLLVDGRRRDAAETEFGIRTFRATADDGFHLNGRRVQLCGVNLHHDHGPLGAAFFPRAMERQFQILKNMGVNAVRTSHNVPAPELLRLCDRMGLIVFNEAFDKYGRSAGVSCDYNEYAATYAERELRNFVRRDRNHPSVFFWSVGNEVGRADGEKVTAKLVEYVKRHDTTRNVSQGFCNAGLASKESTVLNHLDSSGWNYGARYMTARNNYPDKPILYTESGSAFGTRGAYKRKLPAGKTDYTPDGECNGFVLTAAPWSDIPDREFDLMRRDGFVAGEFVWTGFDYLGEPTPFNGGIAKDRQGRIARSSYFGIVDLAGLPKDSYYVYRSHWRPEVTTVHLSPHWNWKGLEGEPIPVFVYTNGDSAELFLNGRSLGRRKKGERPDETSTTGQLESGYYDSVFNYRLFWADVPYEPGELKTVAYKHGRRIGEASVRTAGAPAKLRLTVDRPVIRADGMDLAYVTIEMTDRAGNVCPLAMDVLSFSVEGPLTLMGVANGNPMGFDSFTDATHPLFYGKAVAVLRSKFKQPGTGRLQVGVPGRGVDSEIEIRLSGHTNN